MGRIREWREEEAAALVEEARELLAAGRLIALPTDTFYALGAHPFKEEALVSLFALKGRPPGKPVLLLVTGPEMLLQVVREVPPLARKLMAIFWPGPLTLVLPARPELSLFVTGGTGKVGVRQPRQPVTCRLLDALGFPLTGTSANRAGQSPLTRAGEVAREFGEMVPLILDAGDCPGGEPSTLVEATGPQPRLLRAGAVPRERLAEIVPEILTN
jgi:L-threonylcarbamoyladenylate synthase